jgi:Tol biopolymer transport system component
MKRSTRLVLTTGACHHHPVWTRDGQRVIFMSYPPGEPGRLEQVIADSNSTPEVLWTTSPDTWVYPTDMAPDGRLLLSMDPEGPESIDIYAFDVTTRAPPRQLLPITAHRYGARLSPDGTMIAYTSEETGRMEVYLHRYPSLDMKVMVSTSGGYRPTWSGDGRKLFFRYLDRLMAVDVSTRGEQVAVSPVRNIADHLPDARYDIDAQGRRLLTSRPPGEFGPQMRIDITVGWNPAAP